METAENTEILLLFCRDICLFRYGNRGNFHPARAPTSEASWKISVISGPSRIYKEKRFPDYFRFSGLFP